jgi:hypothetical protein
VACKHCMDHNKLVAPQPRDIADATRHSDLHYVSHVL